MPTVTDNFPGSVLSASWTLMTGSAFSCSANTVRGAAGAVATRLAFWNADSFLADQYAEFIAATVSNHGGSVAMGPAVRVGSNSGYFFKIVEDGSGNIMKRVSGVENFIGTGVGVGVINAGDTIRLTITGSSIVVTQNGSSIATATDSAIASGSPGVYASTNTIGVVALSSFTGFSADPPPSGYAGIVTFLG